MRRILDSYARGSPRDDERRISIAGQHRANALRSQALDADVGIERGDPDVCPCPEWEALTERLASGISDGVVVFGLWQFVPQAEEAARFVKAARQGFVIYDSDARYDLTTPLDLEEFGDAVKAAQDYRRGAGARRVVWGESVSLVQSRRGRPPEDRYLCSGSDSPVRCGNCGGHLTVKGNSRGKTYEDGVSRRHYQCFKAGGGCGRTIADWRTLDGAISKLTIQRLTHPDQLATIRDLQAQRLAQRRPHEEEIARVDELRVYWDQRLNAGRLTPPRHAELVAELDAAIGKERSRLERLDADPVPELDDEMIAEIIEGWKTATPADKRADLRRVWRGFHILVQPGSSSELDEADVRRRIARPKRISSK